MYNKKVNYFPHDANTSRDPKIEKLEFDLGLKGYAVFFKILEKLCENSDGFLQKNYKLLSKSLHISAKLLQNVIENYDLFVIDNEKNIFYSERFLKFLSKQKEVSNNRKSAGCKGAEERWRDGKCYNKTMAEPLQKNENQNSKCYDNKNININIKENTDYVSIKEKNSKVVAEAEILNEKNKRDLEISPQDEREKICGQKEKDEVIPGQEVWAEGELRDFEKENFQKPLPEEEQQTVNDWKGNFELRFKTNLKAVVREKQWREFSQDKYKIFTREEKKEIFSEFILRNATQQKYTAIFYDRDLQNEIRNHLINFLDKKITIKKQKANENNGSNATAIGSEYKTQYATDL